MAEGGWVATYDDVTERHRTEQRVAHMARHDALTGLPNRVLFHDHARHALTEMRRGEGLAVLCLDLDHFKAVNDALGHRVGDALLLAVAARLLDCTQEADLVVRLGGDEFALVRRAAGQPCEAKLLAERVIGAMATPFEVEGHQIVIGTSIGIAFTTDERTGTDELLKGADIALYRAKAEGRGTFRFFEAEMDARIQARRRLELDLRQALAEGQFEVHYQPLISVKTRAVNGAEALVRWRHPTRGMVSPAEFIPVAEETGLISALGIWVLDRACADAMTWPDYVKVAVNLSPEQFKNPRLADDVAESLDRSGLPPHRLELEITESLLLQDSDAILSILHELRAHGVRMSMDDFGTGYSSLSYLRRFPFDKIKIDQSFVRNLSEREDCVAIVRAVIGLGRSLGMSVTAEGVETEEQFTLLEAEGCNQVQGYLFSPPQPIDAVSELIDRYVAQPLPA
jgi:diguanylate cyclase (GGDEF)-like protein